MTSVFQKKRMKRFSEGNITSSRLLGKSDEDICLNDFVYPEIAEKDFDTSVTNIYFQKVSDADFGA